MPDIDFRPLAEDSLNTLTEIADSATSKLSSENSLGTDSFASGNTLTGSEAFQNLASIKKNHHEEFYHH